MFLCGHSGVTEALGKQNPLSLSHSKDCPVFKWRGYEPSSGTGDLPQGLHRAIPAQTPMPGCAGSWGKGILASPWLLGMLAPGSFLAHECDTTACLRARAALSS